MQLPRPFPVSRTGVDEQGRPIPTYLCPRCGLEVALRSCPFEGGALTHRSRRARHIRCLGRHTTVRAHGSGDLFAHELEAVLGVLDLGQRLRRVGNLVEILGCSSSSVRLVRIPGRDPCRPAWLCQPGASGVLNWFLHDPAEVAGRAVSHAGSRAAAACPRATRRRPRRSADR
jgi:hypothetical protein